MLRKLLAVTWITIAVIAVATGYEYYLTPVPDRAFAAGHETLAPHAIVGHSYGVAGSLMMLIGVTGYSLRRRVTAFRKVGKLKDWLDVHIFLCTLGPFLVVLHTSLKVGGVVSIAFWSMTIVVLSGFFGRYVYAHIPKTVHGQFLSLNAAAERRTRLAEEISTLVGPGVLAATTTGVQAGLGQAHERAPGLMGSLILAARYDLSHRRERKRISAALTAASVPAANREVVMRTLSEEARLRGQIVLLRPFQRLFHYWHVVHLPLAIVMFLIVILHVAVAIAFGYGWGFA